MMKSCLEALKTHIQKHQIAAACAGAHRDQPQDKNYPLSSKSIWKQMQDNDDMG